MTAVDVQCEWPSPSTLTGIRTTGHCSACTAGRIGEDASVTKIEHISAMADRRFLCFCDACLTVIASFAPKVTP